MHLEHWLKLSAYGAYVSYMIHLQHTQYICIIHVTYSLYMIHIHMIHARRLWPISGGRSPQDGRAGGFCNCRFIGNAIDLVQSKLRTHGQTVAHICIQQVRWIEEWIITAKTGMLDEDIGTILGRNFMSRQLHKRLLFLPPKPRHRPNTKMRRIRRGSSHIPNTITTECAHTVGHPPLKNDDQKPQCNHHRDTNA